MNTIQYNIRKARLYSGLSQEKLAARIGISRQAYYNIESGRTRLIHKKLELIARECGVPLEDLLTSESDN